MKKVLAIAFIGSLFVVNCSKKPNHDLQDSNIMMEEPEAPTVADSTTKPAATPTATPATPTPEAAKTDSTAKK